MIKKLISMLLTVALTLSVVTVVAPAAKADALPNYVKFEGTEEFTIKMEKAGSIAPSVSLQYSFDGSTWNDYSDTNRDAISSGKNKVVYFRGTNTGFAVDTNENYNRFVITPSNDGKVAASGNIMALLDYQNPSTTITALSAFTSLFRGCDSLTSAPDLPATTVSQTCYMDMFRDCTSLTAAPKLPATTLAEDCYRGMFRCCTSLTSAPDLPATTLADYCYAYMFQSCRSLTSAPDLPATTLSKYCYGYMFQNCNSLTSSPKISATTLKLNCYGGMFSGCTSLTSVPELKYTTLEDQCYFSMFNGCTSLKMEETTDASSALWVIPNSTEAGFWNYNMLKNTAGSATSVELGKMYKVETPKYLKFEGTEEFTIQVAKNSSAPSVNLQYSTDGTNWSDYSDTNRPVVSSSNKVIYLRGTNDRFATSNSKYNYFVITPSNSGTVAVSGNIMALLNYSSPATTFASTSNFAFPFLFKNCSSLTSAPSLPATTLAEYCYYSMFKNCTGLTKAPELPAETLAINCYSSMFSGCTGLTEAPELSAKTLAGYCYSNMFSGCTGLTKAPELPAETLADYCYSSMFNGCTGLTSVPSLPVETLVNSCYSAMFYGCTGLTKAPSLPATTLADSCYNTMFSGCTGITEAPELKVTTLANKCYSAMFYGCTGLTKAPELPAETLTDNCYAYMFNGCTGLAKAPELKATTLANKCYYQMFQDCTSLKMEETTDASEALWIMPSGVTSTNWNTDTLKGTSGTATSVESGKMYKVTPNYLKFEGTEEFTIQMKKATSNTQSVSLQYSFDGATWYNYSDTDRGAISSGENKVVYFRGTNTGFATSTSMYNQFVINPSNNGKVAASGNLMTLLNYKNPPTTVTSEFAFLNLFRDCTSLTSAPELPATTLAKNSYRMMFQGCTGLTKAPELPATTLAASCYYHMFNGCTSLTSAPELPATTLVDYCYYSMFYGCTGLTKAPELKATTIAKNCYNAMFYGCTGLTEAPELKATELFDTCYKQMFYGCTSLTSAPELPATTLVDNCYNSMFANCTGLTEAPELKATTLAKNCYNLMFQNCTSLTSAPELPATTLAVNCYWQMFYGCTGLTKAPKLEATTLATNCYNSMFNGCTSLKMQETTDVKEALWVMPSSTTATNWNNNMLKNTTGPATSVELGKMYKIASPYLFMVGETGYQTAASLNAAIADGTIAEESTIVLTGLKPDGTIVLDGKDMTIDGSGIATGIVLPDNGVLVSATNSAKVNVLGTIPTTGKEGTVDAPIYSEGIIFLGADDSSKVLTTTGSVYQAKTVAEFATAGATLTESIALNVSALVAPKTGDVITIAAKEGTAGETTYNQQTGLYEATISGIYLSHIGNDLGLSVKANDVEVETLEDYTTVNYLSDAATADGTAANMKTLIANLIIACKYINDVGEGNKGAVIDLSASDLTWIESAKTTEAPAKKTMTINTSTKDIRIAAAGVHVTDKLNLFVEIMPRGEATEIPKGTYIRTYINDGNGYVAIDAEDSTVFQEGKTQWYAYIDKIAPTQYNSDIKVVLFTKDNVIAQTLFYSVNTYCYNMSGTYADLCTAIYNYGTAAKAVAAPQ